MADNKLDGKTHRFTQKVGPSMDRGDFEWAHLIWTTH